MYINLLILAQPTVARISHFNHSNRIRNEQVMVKIQKLVETGKAEQGVPVHHCSCTGTLLLLVGVYRYTNVHVPVHLLKFAQNVYFLPPFSHIFDTQFNSILHIHLKTISYSFYNLFSIQFLFQYLSLLQKSTMNYSQRTLIWVMTHTQTK